MWLFIHFYYLMLYILTLFASRVASGGVCDVVQWHKISIWRLTRCAVMYSFSRCGALWPTVVVWTLFGYFLSLACKVQGKPPILWCFHLIPLSFYCFAWSWFLLYNFDLFQLGPSIEIDYIFMFQFGFHSFNFWIGFKSLNILNIRVLISSILSFNWNW